MAVSFSSAAKAEVCRIVPQKRCVGGVLWYSAFLQQLSWGWHQDHYRESGICIFAAQAFQKGV